MILLLQIGFVSRLRNQGQICVHEASQLQGNLYHFILSLLRFDSEQLSDNRLSETTFNTSQTVGYLFW